MIQGVDKHTIDILIQLLETLVEFAQGCTPNQQAIFDAQAIDDVNVLLRRSNFKDAPAFKVCSLCLYQS